MSEGTRIEVARPALSGGAWWIGSLPSAGAWWARALPNKAGANAARHAPDPHPLAELTRRLSRSDEPAEWRFTAPTSDTLDGIESIEQFWDACVEDGVSQPVRSYEVDGHADLRIVVPERYAAQLDAVRAWRLRDEAGRSADAPPPLDPALLDCALPEDLIPALDALPGQQVRHLVLADEAHPLDTWFARVDGEGHTVVMDVDAQSNLGSVTFHRLRRSDPIESDLRHAWVHLVPRSLVHLDAAVAWMLAMYYDEDTDAVFAWTLDAHDLDGIRNEEILVVQLSEVVFHPDPERLRALAAEAPILALALGEIFRQTIDPSAPEDRLGRRAAEVRVREIEEQIRPRALDTLVALVRGEQSWEAQTAAQLLAVLREGARLKDGSGPTALRFLFPLHPYAGYLEQMQGWTWLRTLDLSFASVDDDALDPLPAIGPIGRLTIRGSIWRRIPFFTAFKRMPALRHLELDLSHGWSDTEREIWVFALEDLTWLETLTLPSSSVTERALERLRTLLPDTTIFLC